MLEDKGIYIPPKKEMVRAKQTHDGRGMRYGTRKKKGLYLNKTKQALYIIAYDVALSRGLPVNCRNLHYISERRDGLEAICRKKCGVDWEWKGCYI